MFLVFWYTIDNLVHRMECVPYLYGSKPISSSQVFRVRVYCRVVICSDLWNLLLNKDRLVRFWTFINSESESRVCLVISNWTGFLVFIRMTVLRFAMRVPCATSLTLSLTRSQLRNLLSSARLNRVRPRSLLAISNRVRIAQTSLSFSGGFALWVCLCSRGYDVAYRALDVTCHFSILMTWSTLYSDIELAFNCIWVM